MKIIKHTLVLFILVLTIGCEKEEQETDPQSFNSNIAKMTTSYGSTDNPTVYTNTYSYNSENQLISIEDSRTGEPTKLIKYRSDGRLDSILFDFDLSSMVSRFTRFEYENDKMSRIIDNYSFGVRRTKRGDHYSLL